MFYEVTIYKSESMRVTHGEGLVWEKEECGLICKLGRALCGIVISGGCIPLLGRTILQREIIPACQFHSSVTSFFHLWCANNVTSFVSSEGVMIDCNDCMLWLKTEIAILLLCLYSGIGDAFVLHFLCTVSYRYRLHFLEFYLTHNINKLRANRRWSHAHRPISFFFLFTLFRLQASVLYLDWLSIWMFLIGSRWSGIPCFIEVQ